MAEFKIRTYNNIAIAGLERFPRDRYEVASEIQHPDAIILRSHNLHDEPLPETVKAIGRAGAGVNNIPVAECSRRGIVVFNTPGANANAVKELVIAAMLLAARNICQGWDYVRHLEGDDHQIHKQVEAGKKRFAGFELAGKMLGVVGLGAIGVRVANKALALGMNVSGYDPYVTVERAWQLSSSVIQASSLDELLGICDFVTLHMPLTDQTRGCIDQGRLASMKDGAVLLNFSRGGLVDEAAVLAALDAGKLHAYVTDFPTNALKRHPKAICLPHLGASTREAEENCAVMVADQLRDFLENGNIRHSVNFPEAVMTRAPGTTRLSIPHANVPAMVSQISACLGEKGINIVELLNKSRGEIAYTLIDAEGEVGEDVVDAIRTIDGVLAARRIP
ncbi:D-3-phosphoglycerate dehydrogenase/2-oxoglutarate reductase [Methylomarinovum caldicuralii]|uniref:D-3-phosphoglycerate dehydrogenase n=1 Tax=Methylomarinovum caldicuralii TaxID=438856 RepID=A0AAU9BZ07_9GAMM|nr:phosphoglycerate dehydrogenase [Methylomarinovum caldicuralii]BCX81565.1 D-3-phosphoglycerate dehydrogenase/2-oxoglutarate reductase [Methylomarinovum caldicuralii]